MFWVFSAVALALLATMLLAQLCIIAFVSSSSLAMVQALHLTPTTFSLPFGLGALVSAGLAAAFDGTTRPMALTIAIFGAAAFLAERLYFRKIVHG